MLFYIFTLHLASGEDRIKCSVSGSDLGSLLHRVFVLLMYCVFKSY